MSTSLSRALRGPVGPIVAMTISAAAIGAVTVTRDSGPATQEVIFSSPLEQVSSSTPQDWVNAADAVVVARVVDETEQAAPASGTERGEGHSLVGRDVSLAVDQVIWRAPKSTRTPEGTFTFAADGWIDDGKHQLEMAVPGSSRLEVGHTYVVAVAWAPRECGGDGDAAAPARWIPIGSGAKLPADDSVLGAGEFEGQPTDRVRVASLAPSAVLTRLVGRTPADLAAILDETPVGERKAFDVIGSC